MRQPTSSRVQKKITVCSVIEYMSLKILWWEQMPGWPSPWVRDLLARLFGSHGNKSCKRLWPHPKPSIKRCFVIYCNRWRSSVPLGLYSDGRQNNETDTRIGKSDAVLRAFYRSVVTKWELSNSAKLSVFKSVFVLIIIYGHESWVMTEITLSQVQAA